VVRKLCRSVACRGPVSAGCQQRSVYSVRPRCNLELPALRYWRGIVRRRESMSTGVSRCGSRLHRDRRHCWLPSLALPLRHSPWCGHCAHLVAGCCKVVPLPSWIQTLVVLNHSRDDDQPSRSNEQTCGLSSVRRRGLRAMSAPGVDEVPEGLAQEHRHPPLVLVDPHDAVAQVVVAAEHVGRNRSSPRFKPC
jgi:hypothetical protein